MNFIKTSHVSKATVETSYSYVRFGLITIGWFRNTVPDTDSHWSWAFVEIKYIGGFALRPAGWVFALFEKFNQS